MIRARSLARITGLTTAALALGASAAAAAPTPADTVAPREVAAADTVAPREAAADTVAPREAAADTVAPRGAVAGVRSPLREPVDLAITAADDGGLAAASALVDGVLVARAALGGGTAVDAFPLRLDPAALALGAHRLEVRVSDTAGNEATIFAGELTVAGPPPVYSPTVRVTVGHGSAGTVLPSPVVPQPSPGPVVRRCDYPRLRFAPAKRVRRTPAGRARLKPGRHRFTGRLTCRAGKRRIAAPRGIDVLLTQKRGKRLFGWATLTTATGGGVSVRLSIRSSRTLIVRARDARVRLALLVRR